MSLCPLSDPRLIFGRFDNKRPLGVQSSIGAPIWTYEYNWCSLPIGMNTVNKQELGPGTSLYVKLIIRQETPSFKLFINPFWPGFYVLCSKRLPLCRRMWDWNYCRTVATLALAVRRSNHSARKIYIFFARLWIAAKVLQKCTFFNPVLRTMWLDYHDNLLWRKCRSLQTFLSFCSDPGN